MRQDVHPTMTVRENSSSDSVEVLNHDAFGTITMSCPQWSGDGTTLFGSDLPHSQTVRITIQRARLDRHLSRDWIHGENQPIVEIEMSHAQFAQFITSQGNGNGTPVTIRQAPERGTFAPVMPGIAKIETKHETHRREINRSAMESIQKVQAALGELQAMADAGKVSVKDLKARLHTAKCHINNLPANLEYAVKSAEEALAKATSDAKIEVETYIGVSAQRIGLQRISDLARLENKPKAACLDSRGGEPHQYSRQMLPPGEVRKCVYCGEREQ